MSIVSALKKPLRPLKKPIYALEKAYRARLPGKLRMPDFVGLGAGQAGSTWLFAQLEKRPDVFVARKKETHYFTRNFHEWSLAYYASLFEEGGDRISGEITPGYNVLRPERIEFMHKIMPDVRLILTVRNPIERSWSAARRVMSKLAEQWGVSFDQIPDDEFYEYFSKEWFYRPERGMVGDVVPGLTQGYYSRTIDNWTRVFPEEQLLVCFFDEMRNDPQAYLRRVLRHIGANDEVDLDAPSLRKKVNSNPEHAMPQRFHEHLAEKYRSEIEELGQRYGEQVGGWQDYRGSGCGSGCGSG